MSRERSNRGRRDVTSMSKGMPPEDSPDSNISIASADMATITIKVAWSRYMFY